MMMNNGLSISLINTGKRYNRDWIFRNCTLDIRPGTTCAIIGPNGSGKSTLLQVIAGAMLHNEGKVNYQADDKDIESPFSYISIAAPYLHLIEQMTALEAISFHKTFKSLSADASVILGAVGLRSAANKQVRYFSSGMKQRLKLGLAFFSETPVLLLDEPATNLDADGIALYKELVAHHTSGRTVIVSSNDPQEYDFCTEIIRINDYKPE